MTYDIKNFQTEVIDRSRQVPVLVDFWAEWCGPCKILGPVLERLAEKSKGEWELAKLNTEEFPQIAAQYGIRSIPNVKLFVDGEVVDEFVGALPEEMIIQWLGKALPSKYREQLRQARELLSQQNISRAQKLLEEIVSGEADNHEAVVLLAQTYLYSDTEKAMSLVAGIEEDSDHFNEAESVRTFTRLFRLAEQPDRLPDNPVKPDYLKAIEDLQSQNFLSALENFIDIVAINRSFDGEGARKACIAIFKFFGEEHEITRKFRPAFSSALYS